MENKIYLKLTTVPQTEGLKTDSKEFQLYKDKYAEVKNIETDNGVLEEYYSGGLNPLFSKIHSITVGYVLDNTVRVQELTGNEKDVLTELLNLLNSDYFKNYILVLWNFSFNLPFITTRMLKHRMDFSNLPQPLRHQGLKSWDLRGNKDLQAYCEGVGWFKSSLEEYAFNLSLNTKFIDGKDVSKYIDSGKYTEVYQSNFDYIFTMVNIDRILSGAEEITDINTTIKEIKGAEIKEPTVLEKLYSTNQLTDNLKKDIKKLTQKKRLNKKDKDNLFTILRGVMVKTDFENNQQDSKKVIAEKEKEIQEFIKTL